MYDGTQHATHGRYSWLNDDIIAVKLYHLYHQAYNGAMKRTQNHYIT